jgi:hypothetical protein
LFWYVCYDKNEFERIKMLEIRHLIAIGNLNPISRRIIPPHEQINNKVVFLHFFPYEVSFFIWNVKSNWCFELNAWDTILDHLVFYLWDGVAMEVYSIMRLSDWELEPWLTTIIPPHEQIIMFCVIVLIFSSVFPYEVSCCFSSKDGVILLI